jgi:hypothetical protein
MPKAFISYSWDNDDHKAWVKALATRLRGDGVESILDKWETVPGDQLPAFMERAIRTSDYVLIVCTPKYKERSEGRIGGVGYEGDIISAEIFQKGNHRKFIPILRTGPWADAAPSSLAGKYRVDLRDGPSYETYYQEDLLNTLLGKREKAPPVTHRSAVGAGAVLVKEGQTEPPAPPPPEPVRILGVVVDEVGEPRNDGTRGSALYRVPFRLSRRVSSDWATVFELVWNNPPRFTLMHRPGIARAYGDQIVLDGTTLEEVQKHHRQTLKLCVEKTNAIVEEQEAKAREAERVRREAQEQHQRKVRELAEQVRFDDPEESK